ncbi:hypothetical protein [Leifsonia sp. NPDC058248]|uniref:hypothetical protein n=1 Tax=Leifsonia sp. NPDC058248 TaxID=3346402 RepID=UPI0036D93408
MSISKTLFPPANREAALVAFLRTFWQVIRPPIVLGSLGLATITTTGVLHVDLKTVAIIAGVAVLSAIVSGLLAAGDILKNGLPNAYANAAIASVPAAVVSSVPIPAPTGPAQPAAGVPPATIDGTIPEHADPAQAAAAVIDGMASPGV